MYLYIYIYIGGDCYVYMYACVYIFVNLCVRACLWANKTAGLYTTNLGTYHRIFLLTMHSSYFLLGHLC